MLYQDTLRECPPDHNTDVDYACNPSLQFISPMYFVSFVLTAQFVLINVVVAVLMKHLDDSNKEAQEEAEMDAEIELELAQGTLCCMGTPSCGGGGVDKGLLAGGSGQGGAAAKQRRADARGEKGEAVRKIRQVVTTANQGPYSFHDSNQTLYSPAQVSISVCVSAYIYLCLLCDSAKGLLCVGEGVYASGGVSSQLHDRVDSKLKSHNMNYSVLLPQLLCCTSSTLRRNTAGIM